MDSGIDWPREGSYEPMLRVTPKAEQLDKTLMWVPTELQRLPGTNSLPDGFPIVWASQVLQIWMSRYDSETSNHVQRVMWLAESTARQLAQSEEEIYQLRLAALLHDIGKVGISAMILHKPGPLTQEERSVIHCHPGIGRQILEQVGGIFHQVANIVGAHHERWDGQGYPGGIATINIPLHARILAVVDAYDAMTSQRVYQQHPYSVAQACRELQRCAGSQFDPWVIQAFLHMLEEHSARVHVPLVALKSRL